MRLVLSSYERSAARMLAFYRRRPGLSPTEVTVLWTPFVLMLFSSLAVRTAFTLPVEQRANWIFRMTEAPSARLQALTAAMRSLLFWGVTLPVLASAPLHWTMFDERALATLAKKVDRHDGEHRADKGCNRSPYGETLREDCGGNRA